MRRVSLNLANCHAEFRGDLWQQKTRLPELSCGVVCVILLLAVLVELRLVTDRQTDTDTDRQTDKHRHRPMASTAHALQRAVKIITDISNVHLVQTNIAQLCAVLHIG